MSRSQYVFSIASIVTGVVLVAACGYRVLTLVDLTEWWVLPAFVAGMAIADLLSGLIHWAADTWGRDDLPVIGYRLLLPFRLHHTDPDDLVRRPFVDANGDSAFLTIPVLAALLLIPLDAGGLAPVAVFGLALCGIGMWTNQIHKWAHMPSPPPAVRLLQASGMILGRGDHAEHHRGAYDGYYCITTGWWNRPLEAIDFFRRAERLITRTTGAQPRDDDARRSR